MNIVDRLKIYMEHTGLPISQFADAALIPRPTLSQILSGRNKKISNEVLEKLHDAFPSLNVAWLLFGDGEMVRGGVDAVPASASLRPDSQPRPTAPQNPSVQISPNHIANGAAASPMPGIGETIAANLKCDSESQQEKISEPIALAPDANKKIQTIMVFYTDNSFEIFTPSQR